MKFYKLKKDATQFYDDKFLTTVESLKFWEQNNISHKALEEVDGVFITYGIKEDKNHFKKSMFEKGISKLHFTLNVRSDHQFYGLLSMESSIKEIMTIFEKSVNSFVIKKYN